MKILLAIDASECSQTATDVVIAQFPRDSAEVRVMNADDWPSGMPTSLAFAEGPAAAAGILNAHDERLRQSAELVSRAAHQLQAAGFQATTAIRAGAPRDAILEAAADWLPDLIVLGSHGRRGLDRFIQGSVSESVARRSPCSVLLVRTPSEANAHHSGQKAHA